MLVIRGWRQVPFVFFLVIAVTLRVIGYPCELVLTIIRKLLHGLRDAVLDLAEEVDDD